MGDVFEEVGDFFGDVVEGVADVVSEVVSPLVEVAAPVLSVANLLVPGLSLVSSVLSLVPRDEEEEPRPAPRPPAPPAISTAGLILQAATAGAQLTRTLIGEEPIEVQVQPGQLSLQPLATLTQSLLQQQTDLISTLLPQVVTPLTQSVVDEVSQLRFLNEVMGGSFFPLLQRQTDSQGLLADGLVRGLLPLFQEFVERDRLGKEVLLPGISMAGTALFQMIRAILTGQEIPADSVLAIFREAMVLIGRTAGPEVKQWLPHIGRLLTVLLPDAMGRRGRVLNALDPDQTDPEVAMALGFAAPPAAAVAGGISLGQLFRWILMGATVVFGSDAYRAFSQQFPAVKEAAAHHGMNIGRDLLDGIELMHSPMKSVMELGSQLFFERIAEEMETLGEATPENVMSNASRLLSIAGGLGMSAHLVAILSEKLQVFKHLGFPQIAAFLVDQAGFQGIARNSTGVMFEAALRSPALRRARARFRPEWPDPRSMEQLFLERQIPEGTYRRYLQEQGWTDEMIEGHLIAVYREARPMDLAAALEDAEVPEEWIQRQLMESGFDDEGTANMLRAIRARGQKGIRGALLAAVGRAAGDGVISLGLAEAYLQPLALKPETLRLVVIQHSLDRYRDERNELRRVLLDAATYGQLTLEDLEAHMSAVGFDERAADHARRVTTLKRGLSLFKEEQAEVKAAMRRLQATRIQTALESHRRFLISDDDLRAILLGHGVNDDEVDSLVREAAIRREPVPRLATVLSPEAQLQHELEQRRDQVLALQRNEVIDEGTSAGLLMALGLEPGEAQREAGIVAARLTFPPEPEKPEPEPPEVRELRQIRTDTALTRFREGLLSAEALSVELRAAGHSPDVVSATVDREVTRRTTAEARARARAAEREFTEQRAALEDAAIASFRRGDLEEAGLEQWLLALGRSPDLAEAIVSREIARRPTPKPEAAA